MSSNSQNTSSGSSQGSSQGKSASFWQKYQLYFLLVAAIIIRQIPIVSIPLNWLETYFHEITHGIAALLTGGEIIRIQLFPNGGIPPYSYIWSSEKPFELELGFAYVFQFACISVPPSLLHSLRP